MKTRSLALVALLAVLSSSAHAQITKVWDGTRTAGVSAPNTGASAATPGLITTLSPNSGGSPGTPAGPVISAQGVVGGVPLPVAGTISGGTLTADQGAPNTAANAWPFSLAIGGVLYDARLIRALSSGTDSILAMQGTSPWVVSGNVNVFGSQAQLLRQTATNFNLATEIFVSGTAIDPRSRTWVLSSGTDSVAVPGVATAANQATGNASLASIDGKLTAPLAVTGPLTDTQLRASPVSVSGPLTDAQLRASPVPVSGTVTSTPSGTQNVNLTQVGGAAIAQGQTTLAGGIPVSIASNQTAIPITDNGGSLTIDTPQLPAALVGGRLDVNLGASPTTLSTDPIDRATRLLGVPYGSQAQPFQQSATNFNLFTELRTGATAYDARQIRLLSSGTDSITAIAYGSASLPLAQAADNSTDSTIKLPVLDARANAADPTWNEGNQVPLSVDLSGHARVVATGPDPNGGATTGRPVLVAGLNGATTRSLQVDGAGALNVNAVGTVTDDTSPVTSSKLPVLAAKASSADQAWTNNNNVPHSVTLAGDLRTRMNDWLGSKAPTVGQKTSANSIPVVLASDQSAETAGTTPTTSAIAMTTTGAQVWAATANVKARKIYNRAGNDVLYCVYYDGVTNVTNEATAGFSIQPAQTWEMPNFNGIVEYTGIIRCALNSGTGSIQATQVL